MWLFEQCVEEWRRERPGLTYEDITDACLAAGENRTYLNVCDPYLRMEHSSMTEAVRSYCRSTGQRPPVSMGELANCVFDSIVLQALWSFREIRQITGQTRYAGLTAIGGGVRNRLLIQRLADALNIPVTTGSELSSAIGNVLMQLYATGELADFRAIQQAAQGSISSETFYPRAHTAAKWEEALLVLKHIDEMKGIWR